MKRPRTSEIGVPARPVCNAIGLPAVTDSREIGPAAVIVQIGIAIAIQPRTDAAVAVRVGLLIGRALVVPSIQRRSINALRDLVSGTAVGIDGERFFLCNPD